MIWPHNGRPAGGGRRWRAAGGRRAAGGFAGNSNPTGFTNPPLPTHKIAILRCRGITEIRFPMAPVGPGEGTKVQTKGASKIQGGPYAESPL